tara:strand:- start:78 stop:983 length:906 start_codon:yes stop_codon:yes gene_type:complete
MAESILEDVDNEEFHVEQDAEENKERIRRDVFTTEREAAARARQIGCVGTHSHDEDGELVFMPCENHEDYIRLTGQDVKEDPEYLDIKTELKAYGDDDDDEDKGTGEFEGYGSIFGNTDLGNDVIQKGAFKRSLRKRGPKQVKLLYQHKTDMPIGVFDEIREDEKGLYVKGRLALQTQTGREAYELMKMGALDGLSIGFKVDPKGYTYERRSKKRVIDEVDLMEVSLVTFPMNPKAYVRSVKGQDISIREWENGLRDAFSISRSEAKAAAKAIVDTLTVRDAPDEQEILAIKTLTNILTGD